MDKEKTNAAVEEDDDFLTGGRGLENLTAQELGRPFLKICQSMTPERNKANGELYIQGLEEGHIFNSLTRKNYGESVTVRFIARAKLWLVFEWGTDGKDGAMIAVAKPDSFPVNNENYGLWEGLYKGEKVRVKEGYNFVALVSGEEHLGPVVIPFFGMGNHDAEALTRKLGTDRTPTGALYNIFAREWTLTTQSVRRDVGGQKQTYYLYGDGKKTVNAKRSDTTLTKEFHAQFVAPVLEIADAFLTIADRDASTPEVRQLTAGVTENEF